MREYIPYILPAIITIVSNVIFYLLIKRRIDSSIEKFKISYSGVFREKIDIYKTLLEKLHDLTLKINQYQYLNELTSNDEIRSAFNSLIKTYSVAKPFLSIRILSLFQKITQDLQAIYEALAMGNVRNMGKLPESEFQRIDTAYGEAVNKLRDNKSLKEIEENIVKEMRSELQTK